MSTGYPQLFPAGFIETQDDCSGPTLYRNQYSRESYGPTLNDFMNKYVTGDITNYDFITMLTYLKFFTRQWNKIPEQTKAEILNILVKSNSPLAAEVRRLAKIPYRPIPVNRHDKNHNNKNHNNRDHNNNNNDGETIEQFGDLPHPTAKATSSEEAVDELNNYISQLKQKNKHYDNCKVIENNNRMSIFVISVVTIIALVIGFLIACVR